MKPRVVLPVSVVCLFSVSLVTRAGEPPSESSPAWYNLHPAESGGAVTVAIESVEAGIQGWSFGLCHDAAAARIRSFGLTPELETIRQGSSPDFVACETGVDEATGRQGLVQAVVLAYREILVLPLRAGGFPVLDVNYEILDDSTSTVEVCDGLRGSGQPIISALTSFGQTVLPSRPSVTVLTPTAKNAWFNASPPISDSAVTISVESTNADIQGWSFGLCHDPAAATIREYRSAPALEALLEEHPTAYYICEEGFGEGREGVVQAFAFLPEGEMVVLPARAGGFPVLEVSYEATQETTIEVCGGLVGSGQPVGLVLTSDSQSLEPSQPAGVTLVPQTPSSRLAYSVEPPEASSVVTVVLHGEDLAVEGWSFALCHRATALDVLHFATSPELETLLDGEPPYFVQNELVAAEPYVAMTQRVLLGAAGTSLNLSAFPDGLPLLGIEYEVAAEDTLKFCDRDPMGTTTFDNGVLVEGISYVPWTRTGARLVQDSLGSEFIRGDADLSGRVNMTDAVYVLMALFMGEGPLPCLDAADANDVGRVDISDPIFILHFLFVGGPLPPAPYPEPGQDLSPRTALGCERGL